MRKLVLQAAAIVCLTSLGWGQGPGGIGGATGSRRAVALPLSGQSAQPGVVAPQQSAAPGAGVSTINSSVQVSGSFAGSVRNGKESGAPLSLSLSDAIKRGLAANLGAITADNSVRASRAQRLQALSALLPNLSANATETVQQVNLAAYGFQFKVPPGLNFSIPSVVGPFSTSQLQGSFSQSVYDAVQRRNWQASKDLERASVLSAKDTRELVVLAVAGTYMQTLAAEARVVSQQAQVDNAGAVYRQSVTRQQAGTNAKIDVMRSLVEYQSQQQRLSSMQADLKKQRISLARIIGLPLDKEYALSDQFTDTAPSPPDVNVVLEQAYRQRPDVQAMEAQIQAAQRVLSAARGERLPSVSVNGDYGFLGPNPANTRAVFAVSGSVNVPIWQGGRVKGDILQAEAALRQREAELADQKARIEQDVRDALIEMETAAGQYKVASTNRDYARETLTEARDRFSAGVATTLEVVQAQEQVAAAEGDYISSAFALDLAKLTLARATGQTEAQASQFLQENRK